MAFLYENDRFEIVKPLHLNSRYLSLQVTGYVDYADRRTNLRKFLNLKIQLQSNALAVYLFARSLGCNMKMPTSPSMLKKKANMKFIISGPIAKPICRSL